MNDFLRQRLDDIRSSGLHRALKTCVFHAGREVELNGQRFVDFASNDYLGLSGDARMIEASRKALLEYGTGGRASRLICGSTPKYDALETGTAAFKGTARALVFSSGFLLNATVLPALLNGKCAVIADRLNHASLIDGARLSGARLFVYPHTDLEALEKVLKRARDYACCLVVTDTVFSMDGDIAPLAEIAQLVQRHDALLMVDEAHATGVLGPQGRGAVEAAGLAGKIDFIMGTYSKALGSLGAFIACGADEYDYLVNTARGLIYTTALPPAVLAASIKGLELALGADEARARLTSLAGRVRETCNRLGLNTGLSRTQIIPVIFGSEEKAASASTLLREKGLFVPAIRFPTVKKGEARLRISLSSAHSDADIESLLDALEGL